MKILLICPKYNFEGYSPTGLVTIASIAENLGHKVKIVDMNVQPLPKDKLKYDLIGITGLSLWKKSIIETSKIFRNLPVIVGGPWASISPLEALEIESIDYVCFGEGEETFKEFLQSYPNVKDVKGIGYKDGEKPILNKPRSYMEEFDEPLPAWHLIKLKKYAKVSISTSRGCPYKCIFCAVHKYLGRKWRHRSVQSILNEIELLVNKFGVTHITFGDSNLTFQMGRFEKICDEIIYREVKTKFDVIQGVRADRLTPRLLKKMKKAGFIEVIIAPESGSQRVINEIIGKKLDLTCIEPVVKTCKEIGLFCGSFFVIGFPWETMEEINQTLALAKKIRSFGCSTYVGNALPLPGTELYYRAKEEGFLRFDGKELENIIHYLGLPRKTHCLSSPYWKPEEIIKICKREHKNNLRNLYTQYNLMEIITKFLRHPIRSSKKILKVIY